MFDEDGRKIEIREFPAKLENFSVAEIENYIAELKDEIIRCEAEAEKKRASQNAADAIFKS